MLPLAQVNRIWHSLTLAKPQFNCPRVASSPPCHICMTQSNTVCMCRPGVVRAPSEDSLRASRRARRFLPKTSVALHRFFRPELNKYKIFWGVIMRTTVTTFDSKIDVKRNSNIFELDVNVILLGKLFHQLSACLLQEYYISWKWVCIYKEQLCC